MGAYSYPSLGMLLPAASHVLVLLLPLLACSALPCLHSQPCCQLSIACAFCPNSLVLITEGCAPFPPPAGTFLYVAFMEVIPKELRDGSRMALKLAALLVGFGLMSLLAIWA